MFQHTHGQWCPCQWPQDKSCYYPMFGGDIHERRGTKSYKITSNHGSEEIKATKYPPCNIHSLCLTNIASVQRGFPGLILDTTQPQGNVPVTWKKLSRMEKIGFQLIRRIMPLFEQIPYHNHFLYNIPTVTICIYVYIHIYHVCEHIFSGLYIYIYVCDVRVYSYSKPKKDINCHAWSAMIISEP